MGIYGKFDDAKYDKARNQMNESHKKNGNWDDAKYFETGSVGGLENKLSMLKSLGMDFYLTVEEWIDLSEIVKNIEEEAEVISVKQPTKAIKTVPTGKYSCWQLYKESISKKFPENTVKAMENNCIDIISQFEEDDEEPVLGMVVGSVQSGKTANMAGVISMAADYNFNFFIILTGTIENLRIQTRDRLIRDLGFDKNIIFNFIDHPSAKSPTGQRLQDIGQYLGKDSKKRFATVCLKNSGRLNNLLNWLNAATDDIKRKLRVVLIDDEADQASVNTLDVDTGEATRINNAIKNIVFCKDKDSNPASRYGSMNYVGYTATPYSNFLNEAKDHSLYPRNFISLLNQSGDYLGPCQIFGVPDAYAPLPYVERIPVDDVGSFKNIAALPEIPNSMKESIQWFICSVAVARLWNLKTPVSMLIHISQKVLVHESLHGLVNAYISKLTSDIPSALAVIGDLYNKKYNKLTKDHFLEEMPNYSNPTLVQDLPSWDLIRGGVERLLSQGSTTISMSENGTLVYGLGIHLCVDNCAFTPENPEDVMRIVYPTSDNPIINECPAFIVIGGQTLSRGLTLQGLTCSYFLRSTKMADTLMQMGRWFGYRPGYELLERIYLSDSGVQTFEFLAKLDYDLRQELATMKEGHVDPREYGPRLDTFPSFKLLKITAKNKMQKAYEVEHDYAEKSGQTIKFDPSETTIESNYQHTVDFVNSLGAVDKAKIAALNNKYSKEHENPLVWFGIDYHAVINYLGKLVYPEQSANIKDAGEFLEWYEKVATKGVLGPWNVVVSSLSKKAGNSSGPEFNHISFKLPTRRKLYLPGKPYIQMKGIADPSDLMMDFDTALFEDNPTNKEYFEGGKKKVPYGVKRRALGMGKTPILVIYVIDKDSGKDQPLPDPLEEGRRVPLDTPQHLVGYYLYIPYGDKALSSEHHSTVTVKLELSKPDLEEGDI